MDVENLLYGVSIIELILTVHLLWRSMQKPVQNIKFAYVALLAGLIFLSVLQIIRLMDEANVLNLGFWGEIAFLIFVVIALLSIRWVDGVVRELNSREQVFVLTSGKELKKRLLSMVGELRGVIYFISLTQSKKKAEDMAGPSMGRAKKVTYFDVVKHHGSDFQSTDDTRMLMARVFGDIIEKRVDHVVFDDIASLSLPPQELERWAGKIANEGRAMKTGGLFLCNKDKLPADVILDLEMFMDKTVR